MPINGYIMSVGFRKAVRGNLDGIMFSCVTYTYIVHIPLLPLTVHNSFLVSIILPSIIFWLLLILIKSNKNYSGDGSQIGLNV